MGRMAKMWPDVVTNIEIRSAVGTFDGQVILEDGKKQGLTAGLQSWKYYEQEAGDALEFQKRHNAKLVFGVTAYQYFTEMADRLRNAELVTYGGETQFNGKTYDLVFVTWKKLKSHKKNDQYLVWVNRENNRLEYCEFTIHDPFLPGGSMLPGSIEFADFKNVDGIAIPHLQYVYLGSPKVDREKNLHRLVINSFTFDGFDASELRPDASLKSLGDAKE